MQAQNQLRSLCCSRGSQSNLATESPPAPAPVLHSSAKTSSGSLLRQVLNDTSLPKGLSQESIEAEDQCWLAFQQAEEAAWDVFQDSLLAYGDASESRLDLLEVYAYSDSRLTECVNQLGGRAKRFTKADGDLSTIQGQKKLYEILQQTQPQHVWMAPECKAWCSWTTFNMSRGSKAHERIQSMRQTDQVHLRLCTRIFQWQVRQGRHFHLEQPVLSKMLAEDAIKPIRVGTQPVTVDMCAFGLRTPISHRPIRKRTTLLTTSHELVEGIKPFLCAGSHLHQQIAGRMPLGNGRTIAVSQFAGSYFKGFAMHVSRILLESPVCAADGESSPDTILRRRVRFKGPDGKPRTQISLPAQKRPAQVTIEGNTRGQPQPRTLPATSSTASSELSGDIWGPVFDAVESWAPTRGSALVPPRF